MQSAPATPRGGPNFLLQQQRQRSSCSSTPSPSSLPAATPTSATAAANTYTALLSPFHQRFIDLETRLRRWRIFKHLSYSGSGTRRNSSRRSASHDPNDEKNLPKRGCTVNSKSFFRWNCEDETSRTCPIQRKRLHMNLSGPPRPRPKLDPVSSSSDSISPEEVSSRFQIIQDKSGHLNINGKLYSGVQFKDLERVEQNAQLGDGAGGSVCKYKFKSRMIAVKQMKRTDSIDESKRIFMDLDVISKCNDCPQIVKYYGYIITFDFVYICMEVMATCLDKLLQDRRNMRPPDRVGLPEEIIGKVAISVVKALDYLKEKHKIMHRDVKPSNILLDWYGNFKLCDFGISGKLIESKAVTKTGCTGYLAPERVNIDGKQRAYDVRADVWSLGITLVQLATGRFPYDYDTFVSPLELMIKIHNEEPPLLDASRGFSVEFCQFVAECLQKDMTLRPKFKDLLDKPFLQRANIEEVDASLWFNKPEEYELQHGRS